MIQHNPYLPFLEKSGAIATHFPPNLREPIDLWPADRVRTYQTDAVREILTHAYQNNRLYREKFKSAGVTPDDFRGLRDLGRFPTLTKDELRGDPWVLLSVPRERVAQVHLSTGTTSKTLGDHIYSLFTWEDIYVDELAIDYPLMVPSRAGDVVINALPYEMSSAGMAFHRALQHGRGLGLVNVGKGGVYSDPAKTLIAARDLAARIMLTTPPYALYLSEVAEECGIDIRHDMRFKLLWLTGEGCSSAYRRRLEAIWGCPCLMYYGSLECGPIGAECLARDGYHITEGHVLVEIIDPQTGKSLPPGMIGEVCVTTLYRRAAPLIRYRVQDLGYLELLPCECCLERPRLGLRGREQDQITIGDKSFSPYYVEEFLYRIDEVGNNYEFLVDRDGLVINVEIRRGVERTHRLAERIRSNIAYTVGEVKEVVLVEHMERTRGKTTRVKYLYPR
jgi:phenylacetate-CoA ligase